MRSEAGTMARHESASATPQARRTLEGSPSYVHMYILLSTTPKLPTMSKSTRERESGLSRERAEPSLSHQSP